MADDAPDDRPGDDASAAFDDLMGRLSHPMAVVTTVADGERAGCLVGFHAQCGSDPPSYAVWSSKANRTFEGALRADTFAVHFLGRDDRDLAELFGHRTGDDVDKFERCSWHPGPGGVPLLDGVADRMVGRRLALDDVDADHVCLALTPVDATVGEGPLMTLADVGDLQAGHEADERRPG